MSEETAAYQVKTQDGIKNLNVFASHGLEILKHSVLLVLYKLTDVHTGKPFDYASGRTLKRSEIGILLGIPYISNPSGSQYALIQGVLDQLKEGDYAHHYSDQGWAITKKGISMIEN